MKRRQFVVLATAMGTVGLAGCAGSSDDAEFEFEADTPEAIIESWITQLIGELPSLDTTEIETRALAMLHSETPLRGLVDGIGEEERAATGDETEIENLEITQTDENLSEEEIDQAYPFIASGIDDETLAEMAQENVVAVATYDEVVDGTAETREQNFFVVPEDGEWRIVE